MGLIDLRNILILLNRFKNCKILIVLVWVFRFENSVLIVNMLWSEHQLVNFQIDVRLCNEVSSISNTVLFN